MPLITVSFFAGVIYCFSRKDTEQVAFELVKRGINACSYHASMGSEKKALNHRNWIENKIQVWSHNSTKLENMNIPQLPG